MNKTNMDDIKIQAVLRHQKNMALYFVSKKAEAYLNEAGSTDDVTSDHRKISERMAKKLKLKYKEDYKKMMKNKWRERPHTENFPT